MYLSNLALTDFRSYRSCEFDLPAGPVVLLGPNGAGKTNLVEAAGYVATLASHRVASDTPLVREGCSTAHVGAVVARDSRSVRIDVQVNVGRANRAWLNRSPVRRPRDILGYARVVTFAPEDLAMVRGDPEERRRYLDDLLVLRTPRLAGVRADLDRALRQRNALLRHAAERGGGEPAGLLEWDAAVAGPAAEILRARALVISELAPRTGGAYLGLAPDGGEVGMRYRSSVADRLGADVTVEPTPDLVRSALEAARREELARGVTVVGPHRDDVLLTLGGRPAKGYASHGETWSLALALRLASFELLRDDWSDTPVLVLDDVFAELDAFRRERLAELATGAEQVLVTAAVEGDVPAALRGHRLSVGDGAVRREEDVGRG